MGRPIKILNVVGARPNFMKVAPLMREYAKHPGRIHATLVHTGQHYDESMSGVFFSELGIPKPDVYLGVGSGSHAEQTARIMMGFEGVVTTLRPDMVLVVGDVNSTMACTLVAAKLNVQVAHVEAGLRSYDRTMPEEINRIVTDALADLLFTTSTDANENLAREGVPAEKVFFVGNTMIDSLHAMKAMIDASTIRQVLRLDHQRYGMVTLHRPSNVDDRDILAGICGALATIQKQLPLIWPLHPRTRKMLQTYGLFEQVQSCTLLEPLSYVDSISLMSSAALVLTDSGGVQEESTVLGVPCLTLRENTERPITVSEGTNELVGSNPEKILEKANEIIAGKGKRGNAPKWWDGGASERIVAILLDRKCNN